MDLIARINLWSRWLQAFSLLVLWKKVKPETTSISNTSFLAERRKQSHSQIFSYASMIPLMWCEAWLKTSWRSLVAGIATNCMQTVNWRQGNDRPHPLAGEDSRATYHTARLLQLLLVSLASCWWLNSLPSRLSYYNCSPLSRTSKQLSSKNRVRSFSPTVFASCVSCSDFLRFAN